MPFSGNQCWVQLYWAIPTNESFTMLQRFFLLTLLLVTPTLLLGTGCPSGKDKLVFGVHPFKTPPILFRSFTPIVTYLSKQLDCPVELYISPNYRAHEKKLSQGKLDFVYAGPALYANRISLTPHHYLGTIENNGSSYFHGHIIAQKDDKRVKRISDLKGKSVAFGDKNSTMSYIVPLYEMKQHNITLDSFKSYRNLGNHDDVALAVLFGTFDAGAVKEEIYNKYRPRGLKSIYRTRAIPEHVFAAHAKLSPKTVKKMQKILWSMHKSKKGMAALMRIKNSVTKISNISIDDYVALRKIFK
jgi:phosphonate transport system substrate-binding protein